MPADARGTPTGAAAPGVTVTVTNEATNTSVVLTTDDVGAYTAVTGMVALDSLAAAVTESLPSYRTQHVARNVAAIRAGFEVAPRDLSPAWKEVLA